MSATPDIAGTDTATKADNRRERFGWYMYDWANSAFTTTVVTVFFGPYLTSLTRNAADASGFVYPLGIPVAAGSFYPYMVSLSVLLQVFVLPILGAIADYSQAKKQLMIGFAYMGVTATLGMFFLEGANYLLGGLLFVIANLCFGASIVFYNAMLPDVSPPDERDAVSSRGWAMGYIGGGVLLLLNLVLYLNYRSFGLEQSQAVRISLASAGLWWGAFTLVPLLLLRRRQGARALPPGERYLTIGFKQLRHTIADARNYPQTLLFLLAYLLYNDGIQAVIALSSQFGQEELGMELDTLTGAILMVQFVAFFGALAFGFLARRLGSKTAILISLVIWIFTALAAFVIQRGSVPQFYILAGVIALVLGGSQAISRSVYSLMIPKGQEAEYFSLYEVSERGTSWLAPLFFGLALQYTNSYRTALASLVIFFILGFIILLRVDIRRAAQEAGNSLPLTKE
ncbi:MAG TPA: MFS transporter [Roseiflexaceae bacterium]|nr:MFS transporter [Roseiflexaceae bacterium]